MLTNTDMDRQFEYIPIELLDPNPFQPRKRTDPGYLMSLAQGIHSRGLLQPIRVRRNGSRFQMVFGHCRADAYRLLDQMFGATFGDKYKRILAEVVDLSDHPMRVEPIEENEMRQPITLVEAAEAVEKLAHEKEPPKSAQDIADETGLSHDKVKLLFRLAKAPQFIKDACAKGLGGILDVTDSDQTLPINSLEEIIRIYEHYQSTSSDELADSKTKALLDQALKEVWTFKRLTKVREEMVSGALEPTPEKPRASKRKTAARPYRRRGTKLYIDTARLEDLSIEQARALSEQLEKILQLLRSKTSKAPSAAPCGIGGSASPPDALTGSTIDGPMPASPPLVGSEAEERKPPVQDRGGP